MSAIIMTLTCQIFGGAPAPCKVEFHLGPAPVVVVTEVPVFSSSFEG